MPTWRECPLLSHPTLILALVVLIGSTAARAQGPSPVVVAQVIQREVTAQQSFTATVMPLKQSIIGSAVDGRVLEYYVDDGERVAAEQPLALLRTATLEIELAAAQAELELRNQELAELQNGSLPEELEQAQARMAAAEALRDYARTRFERTQRLYQSGQTATRDEYDQARSEYLHAEQLRIESQKGLELAVKGPRVERIAQAQARVVAQQENIRHIQDRIDKHTIRSPFDGFISAEHTEKGAWVKQGDPVAEVIKIDVVEIEVFVPETYIRFVRAGQLCNVTLEALPGEIFPGEVARVVPLANPRSRTFPVKVRVENSELDGDYVIKAGMLARVSLPVGSLKTALLVPKDALVLGGATPTVFVVEQNSVRSVPVQASVAQGGHIVVEGSLKPGDRVVVAGNERLRSGAQVQVTSQRAPESFSP